MREFIKLETPAGQAAFTVLTAVIALALVVLAIVSLAYARGNGL